MRLAHRRKREVGCYKLSARTTCVTSPRPSKRHELDARCSHNSRPLSVPHSSLTIGWPCSTGSLPACPHPLKPRLPAAHGRQSSGIRAPAPHLEPSATLRGLVKLVSVFDMAPFLKPRRHVSPNAACCSARFFKRINPALTGRFFPGDEEHGPRQRPG